MRLNFLNIFFMFLFFVFNASAVSYQKYYDTLNCFTGNSIKQTIDNGYIIGGSAYDSQMAQDGVVLKTDSAGNIEWTKIFQSTGSEGVKDVLPLPDGSTIVLAFLDGGVNTEKIWLIKIDSYSDTLWTRIYSLSNGGIIGRRIISTVEGGYAITGNIYYTSAASNRAFIFKTDADGLILWTNEYSRGLNEISSAIIQTKDSGFVIAGQQVNPVTGVDGQLYVQKTNFNGDSLWRIDIGGDSVADVAQDLKEDFDGSIVITGYSWNDTLQQYDVCLLKLGSAGNVKWFKHFSYNGETTGYSLQLTNNGYVIAGSTFNQGQNLDFLLMKTDTAGNIIWTKTFGNVHEEVCLSVERCTDQGFALTGYVLGIQAIFTVKTDMQGSVIGIEDLAASEPVIKIYPNPFSEFATVLFENIHFTTGSTIKIFSIDGKLIKTISPSADPVLLFKNEFAAGLYFLNYSHSSESHVLKFVVQ